jgi:hypothetical protein
MELIRNVPTRYWSVDVRSFGICLFIVFLIKSGCGFFQLQRLYDTIEVEAPTLAFSGQRFFYITKRLILAVSCNKLYVEIS